ncbi:MAG: hypothetical protein HQK54_05215, partial [Oligoflexales bacterium]|nr:hypothetical protein [Oligoflexales bacterium]
MNSPLLFPISLVIAFSVTPSLASESKKTSRNLAAVSHGKNSIQERKIGKSEPLKEISNSSRQNRHGKKFSATVAESLTPIGPVTQLMGTRGTLGYFLSPDNQIEAGYEYAVQLSILNGSTYQDFSGGLKHFFGNSLYAGAGGGYSMLDSVRTKSDQYLEIHKFTSNSTYLNVYAVVGNQWQWSRFTLGADWVRVTGFNRISCTYSDDEEILADYDLNRDSFPGLDKSPKVTSYLYLGF